MNGQLFILLAGAFLCGAYAASRLAFGDLDWLTAVCAIAGAAFFVRLCIVWRKLRAQGS